jgi:hypothetical protein
VKLRYNDKVHGYWLDGKRCKGVSTIAKATDDSTALDLWSKRMVLVGAASSPQLVEAAAAHFDEREKLDELAEEALRLAKSHHAAMTGTAVHRVLERADLGESILMTPDANAVILSWNRLLDAAGFEVVPEYVERIVVYPDRRIAGRLDRILRRKTDGRLFLGDVKTGQNAVKYPHSTAIQLAGYGNAPLMVGAAPSKVDGDAVEYDTFEPMPDIDKDIAYVAHVTGPESIELVPFNIAAAWDAVERIVFPMLFEWRPRTDLVGEPIRAAVEAPVETDDPFDGVDTATPEPSQAGESHKAVAERPADLRAFLLNRCRALAELGHRQTVLDRWPAGAPKVEAMTDEQLAALDAVVSIIEADVEAPFAVAPEPAKRERVWNTDEAVAAVTADPVDAAVELVQQAFPGAELVIDEGDLVDDTVVEDIERRRLLLKAEPRAWVGDRVREMKDAGRPLALSRNPTERRAAIARALIEWSAYIDKDGDEIPRAALAFVCRVDAIDGPYGAHAAELTVDQAVELAALPKQLEAGDVALDYSLGFARMRFKAAS